MEPQEVDAAPDRPVPAPRVGSRRRTPSAWEEAVRAVRTGELDPDAAADRLIGRMTDRELLGLLDGDSPRRVLPLIPVLLGRRPFVAGAIPRLGIPGIRFSDGARGVVIGASTAFPVTMARAATWDPVLEEQVGVAIGLETAARGANYSASVCVNLLRHPAWGRAQECYGEDPVLTGRMGTAITRGRAANVMACVKHFALNSMEDERSRSTWRSTTTPCTRCTCPISRRSWMPGVDSRDERIQPGPRRVHGRQRPLLTDVLRDEWGFAGFVTSDWVFGTHDAVASLRGRHGHRDAAAAAAAPASCPRRSRAAGSPGRRCCRSARRILRTSVLHAATRDDDPPEQPPSSPPPRTGPSRVALRRRRSSC